MGTENIADVFTDHKPVVQVLKIDDARVAFLTWNLGGNADLVTKDALIDIFQKAHTKGPLDAVFFLGQEFAMELKPKSVFKQKYRDTSCKGTDSSRAKSALFA